MCTVETAAGWECVAALEMPNVHVTTIPEDAHIDPPEPEPSHYEADTSDRPSVWH